MTCSQIHLLRNTQDTDACLSEEHTKLHNEIVLILKSGPRNYVRIYFYVLCFCAAAARSFSAA